ncbi:MAG TPA: DUF1622 domain-containing protein [Kofleriaceae bacterium]|nr:DUF1622 domain-containing protein [Kofleriaceae bacterium]
MTVFDATESTVVAAVQWIRLGVEAVGAIIVAAGVALSAARVIRTLVGAPPRNFIDVRIAFARYLALALEFQLGADILSTAIAPSWDQIGKLGAIAVIRTALNFFLTREMREEQRATPDERRIEGEANASGGAPSRR